jgi:hypothetical protein
MIIAIATIFEYNTYKQGLFVQLAHSFATDSCGKRGAKSSERQQARRTERRDEGTER